MTDDETVIQFAAMVVCLHVIAEAADTARQVSDNEWRAELFGLQFDPLPDARGLVYEAD